MRSGADVRSDRADAAAISHSASDAPPRGIDARRRTIAARDVAFDAGAQRRAASRRAGRARLDAGRRRRRRARAARSRSSAAKAASEKAPSPARSRSPPPTTTADRRCSSPPIPRRRSPTRSASRTRRGRRADVEHDARRMCRGSSFGRWTRPRRSRACATSIRRASTRCSTRSSAAASTSSTIARFCAICSRSRRRASTKLFALSVLGDALARGAIRAHRRRSRADRTSAPPARDAGDRARLDASPHAPDAQVPRRRRTRRHRAANCSTSRSARARSMRCCTTASACGVDRRRARRAGRARRDRRDSPRRCARAASTCSAIVWNRVTRSAVPSSCERRRAPVLRRGASTPPPIGVPALREWSRSWRDAVSEFLIVVMASPTTRLDLVRVRHRAGEHLAGDVAPARARRRRRVASSGDGGRRRRSSRCSTAIAYAPAALEANSGDVEWLSPRAVAHDRVLTWASDHGAGRSAADVLAVQRRATPCTRCCATGRRSSRRRSSALARGREYALRVYRVDAELLGGDAVAQSAARARSASAAAAASPGQRYLLERKLEGEKKTEMRAVTQRIVDEIVDELAPHAVSRRALADSAAADADARRAARWCSTPRFFVAPDALRGISENAHDARRASRRARIPIRLHRPVAAVPFRQRDRPMAHDDDDDRHRAARARRSAQSRARQGRRDQRAP